MKIIELNNDLKPVKYKFGSSYDKASMANKCLSTDAYKRNYDNKTISVNEIVFHDTIPDTADMYHHNYLAYIQNTYADHNKMVLSPHVMWYTLMCEVAGHVNKFPTEHASIFTSTPDNKQEIIVPCSNENVPLRIDAIYEVLKTKVPVDSDKFLPKFSTSTDTSNAATLAAFLETCSPYYSYGMLACGHPAIKIDGTFEDWALYLERTFTLIEIFKTANNDGIANYLNDNVLPIIDKIMLMYDKPDVQWLSNIFSHTRCGSGSQYFIDGWFTNMFMVKPQQPEVSDYSTHITKVPYFTLPSNTEWNMCFMLSHSNLDDDGFMIPDFSQIQIKKLKTPIVRSMYQKIEKENV